MLFAIAYIGTKSLKETMAYINMVLTDEEKEQIFDSMFKEHQRLLKL